MVGDDELIRHFEALILEIARVDIHGVGHDRPRTVFACFLLRDLELEHTDVGESLATGGGNGPFYDFVGVGHLICRGRRRGDSAKRQQQAQNSSKHGYLLQKCHCGASPRALAIIKQRPCQKTKPGAVSRPRGSVVQGNFVLPRKTHEQSLGRDEDGVLGTVIDLGRVNGHCSTADSLDLQ